ncbi:hypothetical protein A3F58_01790 [Candidatus Roizmanbacteria bacterium RIFCSPHIGHO2_12_FULL_37_9b]|uniref:Glycosyltransferase 2-like domain-containing protein n=1 Tax=Candidatus Roizmanbacteria bacterium RIFCSPHIGHO2_02_FULL_38_11 TaxID=1802039 RepID=A0A1F7H1F2_9BACT|nr:MAG: hypothetical protein A3C25_01335 [Candidatus Roizmanbacteria bacterium RIFCSPHIGHO2_02_FULL_38_11]OGK34621.1 MAG: hypothetical protein A3F58_01790 [Candidatus Roizmanbacteria bacterium RIFCSPHIGHO2_12_FULL_37_9b]
MIPQLSLLMITQNAEELLEKSLQSCIGLVDEIIVVDNYSKDKTRDIAKKYGVKLYLNKEDDLGKQRKYGLSKVTYEWVLVLDSDEVVSEELKKEIKEVLSIKHKVLSGFKIPFQNHLFGRPLLYGGENYKKLWLFRKDAISISPALVHERFELKKGRIGVLKNKIYHYSYRSLWQTFRKFTDYAIREAKQRVKKGEKTGWKKIILYPPHMFWARFIKDKGYKDGLFRLPLDIGFAYMEFLAYFFMLFIKHK